MLTEARSSQLAHIRHAPKHYYISPKLKFTRSVCSKMLCQSTLLATYHSYTTLYCLVFQG